MSKLNARDKLVKSRVAMLLKYPFWGPLAARLKLEEVEWCKTIATDGRKFYYNAEFIGKLSDGEMIFGFAHELGHIIFDHMTRRGDKNPQVWNMAGDYVINNMLIREGVGTTITTVPILADRKYEGKTADEVYDELMKNAVKIQMPFDEHLDGEGDGEGDGDGADGDKDGKGKPKFKKLTEEERKALKDEWREAVIQAAKQAGAGNTPGAIQRLVKDITAPVMDIKDLLRIQFSGSVKSDYTWMRPNRKSWHTGAVLPGQLPGEELDIVVALDASGSIDEGMLMDFLGMVQGALDQFTSYKVRVITFDTDVYHEDTFTGDDGRSMGEYQVTGGGGTSFECVWQWMKDNEVQPHQLVMFTDGYPFGSWGDPDYCDTLFIVHGNNDITAPFGITANYVPPGRKR
ncbi:vWFA domain containing protein [uncultured Caudovirales phage]|uniref:VWFA domain containing protein n=1 Tax=uncultured Caudovirales phage TaxID=2100421 RepID=A0A6J5TC11_9CAUD|nr:vWFA domain containing protein [uncultured Caudovirales phage]